MELVPVRDRRTQPIVFADESLVAARLAVGGLQWYRGTPLVLVAVLELAEVTRNSGTAWIDQLVDWAGRWCRRTASARRRTRPAWTHPATPAARRRQRHEWTRRNSRAGSPRCWRAAVRARRVPASRRGRRAVGRRRRRRCRWRAWSDEPARRTARGGSAGRPRRRGTETCASPTDGTRRCAGTPSHTRDTYRHLRPDYNCDSSAIRARFERDSSTIRARHAATRYEVYRALVYEIDSSTPRESVVRVSIATQKNWHVHYCSKKQ